MWDVVLYITLAAVGIHGLIHLMGFVAYWPVAEIQDLPYKTTLLSGRWDLHEGGIRLFSVLWLIAAVLFIAAVAGLFAGQAWSLAVLVGAVLLSLIVTAFDWGVAFRGTIIDVVILVVILLATLFTT